MKTSVIVIVVVLVALVTGGMLYFRDTSGPELTLSPSSGAVSGQRTLTLTLNDPGSGLKHFTVTAVQGGKSVAVLNADFPRGDFSQQESFHLDQGGLKDGPLQLQVTATDRSIFHFGAGNNSAKSFALQLDNQPPTVNVLSIAHNITRGGACLILYTLSESPARTGVQVGDRFFPGYLQPQGFYACLFAFPYDMAPAKFTPHLIAVDQAGNKGLGSFYYHDIPRSFPHSKINITDQFLQMKQPYFQHLFPAIKDPLQLFLHVNTKLRAENRARLPKFGLQTSPVPLWHGVFLRHRGAARGYFGAHRTYYHDGRLIDKETHLGIDLASVAQAPILAANAGKVLYAAPLGIYGNCVIIDHGLGLQTLYGHLSQFRVKAGDTVKKGQVIGRTGFTGLAGGDHLHFGVLVSGLPVNPREWWDPSWLKNNITAKFKAAKKEMRQ